MIFSPWASSRYNHVVEAKWFEGNSRQVLKQKSMLNSKIKVLQKSDSTQLGNMEMGMYMQDQSYLSNYLPY